MCHVSPKKMNKVLCLSELYQNYLRCCERFWAQNLPVLYNFTVFFWNHYCSLKYSCNLDNCASLTGSQQAQGQTRISCDRQKKSMHKSLLKHTQEEKRNRITADVVLLQLILRDSFSIKEEQEHNLIVVHKHNHPKPEQKHLWSYQ